MEMVYYQLAGASYQDYLNVLEADIEEANALAAAIPYTKSGSRLQMKLVYNQWAPLLLFFLQRIDSSCICLLPRCFDLFHVLAYKVYGDARASLPTSGRKATIKEFYSVILPTLQRLHSSLDEVEDTKEWLNDSEPFGPKGDSEGSSEKERENECGICLEPCAKMVLPNCCHAVCIKCYRNWNERSESCPFCRSSLKRVKSDDLWVLLRDNDVVDTKTVSKQDLVQFYLYINSLPQHYPDALFFFFYEYLM